MFRLVPRLKSSGSHLEALLAFVEANEANTRDLGGNISVNNDKSGQSQFASLKLRSLALVTSSGAPMRPFELHLWQLHCENLPSGLRHSGQILAAVPRPGFAGRYATVICK